MHSSPRWSAVTSGLNMQVGHRCRRSSSSIRLLQFQRGLAGQPDADQLIQRADALAETFRSYKLPVIPVVTDDLVRALTWRPDFDLEERLSGVRDELAEAGWSSL